jgi:hypothetical protein
MQVPQNQLVITSSRNFGRRGLRRRTSCVSGFDDARINGEELSLGEVPEAGLWSLSWYQACRTDL